MVYAYEAQFEYDAEDACWYVSFEQFDGAFTDAETVGDAAIAATEVLTLYVTEYLEQGWELPAPTFHEPPFSVVCIEVDERTIELTKCLTYGQATEELGISQPRVSQLVKSGRLEAREFDGKKMVTIASVNARKANPPAPHRPKREAVA